MNNKHIICGLVLGCFCASATFAVEPGSRARDWRKNDKIYQSLLERANGYFDKVQNLLQQYYDERLSEIQVIHMPALGRPKFESMLASLPEDYDSRIHRGKKQVLALWDKLKSADPLLGKDQWDALGEISIYLPRPNPRDTEKAAPSPADALAFGVGKAAESQVVYLSLKDRLAALNSKESGVPPPTPVTSAHSDFIVNWINRRHGKPFDEVGRLTDILDILDARATVYDVLGTYEESGTLPIGAENRSFDERVTELKRVAQAGDLDVGRAITRIQKCRESRPCKGITGSDIEDPALQRVNQRKKFQEKLNDLGADRVPF